MDVDVEAQLPASQRELRERVVGGHRGVVDEHVDAPEGVHGLLDDRLAAFFAADVRLHRDRGAARLLDRLDRAEQRALEAVIALFQRARDAGDLRALGGEQLGDRLADAAAGPRHDRDPIVEPAHHRLPFSRARRAACCACREHCRGTPAEAHRGPFAGRRASCRSLPHRAHWIRRSPIAQLVERAAVNR